MESRVNLKIGERLEACRKKADMSRAAVAKRMQISAGAVQAHEEGRNGVKPDNLIEYAKIYRVSVQWILTGEGAEVIDIWSRMLPGDDREAWLSVGRRLAERDLSEAKVKDKNL